jgi:hypothetical protein
VRRERLSIAVIFSAQVFMKAGKWRRQAVSLLRHSPEVLNPGSYIVCQKFLLFADF